MKENHDRLNERGRELSVFRISILWFILGRNHRAMRILLDFPITRHLHDPINTFKTYAGWI